MYLLDTDHISILQRQSEPEFSRLSSRLIALPSTTVYLAIVSFHEQSVGWHSYINQARKRENVIRGYKMFEAMLRGFAEAQVLPFDDAAADVFDSLQAGGCRVGTMDLRIAATSLSRGFTVLTRDVQDFRKVPGLNVEDWTL